MAISVQSSSISWLISDHSRGFTSSASTSLSKSSSLSSLQFRFPCQLRIGNTRRHSHRRRQILPLVESKQQSFSSFDELIANSDKPVLVDFYATWCGPCQFMVPILEQVSANLKDKIQVVKIDTEKYPTLADKYRIEALPTFILFKDGQPSDRFEGALTADNLIQRIEASLAVKQ